ncbi:hypothetical protein BCT58_24445 [Vibrio lentus]|nr:hypothetical protein BCT58_24445 [Vibrio lentus]
MLNRLLGRLSAAKLAPVYKQNAAAIERLFVAFFSSKQPQNTPILPSHRPSFFISNRLSI